MKVKSCITSTIRIGGWFYVNYIIYLALVTGEFNPIGKSVRLVSYGESPIWFVISLGFTVAFSFIFLVLVVCSARDMIDRKVRSYGGNYNLNTFRAIMREWRG